MEYFFAHERNLLLHVENILQMCVIWNLVIFPNLYSLLKSVTYKEKEEKQKKTRNIRMHSNVNHPFLSCLCPLEYN